MKCREKKSYTNTVVWLLPTSHSLLYPFLSRGDVVSCVELQTSTSYFQLAYLGVDAPHHVRSGKGDHFCPGSNCTLFQSWSTT
jgi:hypothetical protein